MSRRLKRRAAGPVDFSVILNRKVEVLRNGEPSWMHPIEAGLRQLVAKAIRGDMKAAKRFLMLSREAGILRKPEPKDDHEYLVRIPKDWDRDEWWETYLRRGPPPWPGARDGLTVAAREERYGRR